MLLDTARAGLKLAILIPLHFNLAQRKILVTKLGLLYQNCLIKCLTFRVNTSVSFILFSIASACRVSQKYVRWVSAVRRCTYGNGRLNLEGLCI